MIPLIGERGAELHVCGSRRLLPAAAPVVMQQQPHVHGAPSDGDAALARKTRNWKLIVDPLLQKGGQKVYRTEGLVAGVSDGTLSSWR